MNISSGMGLDAEHGAVNGVKALATQAKREGATRDEVMEALRVVLYVGGEGCVYTAAAALRDLDL